MIKTSTYLLFNIAMNRVTQYSLSGVRLTQAARYKLMGMQVVVFHANINSSAAHIVQILILTIWIFSFGYFPSLHGMFGVFGYHVLINMEWGFYIGSVFAVHTHGLGVFITYAIWMVAYVMTKLNSVSRSAWRLLLDTGQMRYILSPVFTVYKH
jgi:hypothetical protein